MDPTREPVIAGAVRTPLGKAGGVLADVRSEDLSIPLIEALLDDPNVDPADVDDLLWGCAQQRGEQDNNLARIICLLSPLGERVPGATINRWCASSMHAIAAASDAIRAGGRRVVIAGGVESMSRIPMDESYASLHPGLGERYEVVELQMGMTAETVADRYDVPREVQDRFALRSHRRAAAATDDGRFAEEIVPIEVDGRTISEDEGIRRDTSLEALADLPPAFTSNGSVTAGNASQLTDGAAATLVCSRAFAEDRGLEILAAVGANHVVGVDPIEMGIGPIPATRELLERSGRSIDDYDLVEINEAFASQCEYARRELGIPADRLNVNGGAIALGHPLGASGARLPVTLLHELRRRDGHRGLATLCVGFGQGYAIEFERPG